MTTMRLAIEVKYRPSRDEIVSMALDKFGLLLAPDVVDALMDTERDPENILRYALKHITTKPAVLTLTHLKGAL